MDVRKSKLLKTIPKWGNFYNVEADITVNKMPSIEWTNVFHFSQNGNIDVYGDRIPAVFIHKAGYFHICSGVNGNKDFSKDVPFVLGKKYNLEIQQKKENGKKIHGIQIENDKTIYEIKINGKIILSTENKKPRDFDNVKVYVSDPWHNAFTANIGILSNFQDSSRHAYEQEGK